MKCSRTFANICCTAFLLIAGIGVFTWFSTVPAPPHGDEPHYLMMSISLIRDGDLNLENNYTGGDSREFMKQPVTPHWGMRRDGVLLSSHDPGVSVLMALPYLLDGRRGTCLAMALLGILALLQIPALARALEIPQWAAHTGILMAGLSLPYLMMSGKAFPEIPAALGIMLAARWLLIPSTRIHPAAGIFALSLIPWFHMKYAVISILFFAAFLILRRPSLRTVAIGLLPAIVSAAALLLFQHSLYGDVFYLVRMKRGAFQWPLTGMTGLLMDREAGLLVFAPILAPGVLSLLFRWRRHRVLNAMAVIFVLFWMLSGSWADWHSGHCPPARYLIPFVPMLGLFTARELAGTRRVTAWIVFGSLWPASLIQAAGVFMTIPETAIVHYDGINRLWTRFLPGDLAFLAPSFLNPSPGTLFQTAACLLLLTAISVALWKLSRRGWMVACLGVAAAVSAGYGVTVEAAYHDAVARTPLPKTGPRLLEPPPDRVYSGAFPTLAWEAVPGADGYIWEIEFPDGDLWTVPQFGRTRIELPSSITAAAPKGRYCWRIIPTKQGRRGIPSEKRCFVLLD